MNDRKYVVDMNLMLLNKQPQSYGRVQDTYSYITSLTSYKAATEIAYAHKRKLRHLFSEIRVQNCYSKLAHDGKCTNKLESCTSISIRLHRYVPLGWMPLLRSSTNYGPHFFISDILTLTIWNAVIFFNGPVPHARSVSYSAPWPASPATSYSILPKPPACSSMDRLFVGPAAKNAS